VLTRDVGAGNWTVDSRGAGCAVLPSDLRTPPLAAFTLPGTLGNKALGRVGYSVSSNAPSALPFAGLPVEVRSSEDPSVVALRLLNGSLAFPAAPLPPPSPPSADGPIIMIAIGAVLCTIEACAVF
jgi:hypothetical protein